MTRDFPLASIADGGLTTNADGGLSCDLVCAPPRVPSSNAVEWCGIVRRGGVDNLRCVSVPRCIGGRRPSAHCPLPDDAWLSTLAHLETASVEAFHELAL